MATTLTTQTTADTIHLQPRPLCTVVAHPRSAGVISTAITRMFALEDVPRCRLCETCSANRYGICLMVIPDDIPSGEAKLFSLATWRRARS